MTRHDARAERHGSYRSDLGLGVTLLSLTKATTGSDINQDMQLDMAPQTQSGLQNVTVTYTFTTN